MMTRSTSQWSLGIAATALLIATITSHAQQPGKSQPSKAKPQPTIKPEERVSIEVARDRATLMHKIYESTLHSLHRHYFRSGISTLPARAMEDVFAEMKDESQADARWIAVNTKAMSINHEPETDFENLAVKEISSGKEHIERVENGFYRRATAIPLGAGCVSCHHGLLAPPPQSPRYAGLVISIPIHEK